MSIASRTPEGDAHFCEICGAVVVIESSQPFGDSVCPRCGSLVLRLKEVLKEIGYKPESLDALTPFASEVDQDSLDTVELVMRFEEEFDLQVTDDEAEKIQTVADAIRFILKKRYGTGGDDLPSYRLP
jgi:acyl carrier protein